MERIFICVLSFFVLPASVLAATNQTLKKMNETLSNARCVPNFENGKPAGYKCFQEGGEESEQGNALVLKDNDVIVDVDGNPVSSSSQTFDALGEKKSRKITVKSKLQTKPVSEIEQ